MNKYWMVHNPERYPPRVTHTDIEGARREAERLAVANPGQVFVILEAVEQCKFEQPVKWTKVEDEIPFRTARRRDNIHTRTMF